MFCALDATGEALVGILGPGDRMPFEKFAANAAWLDRPVNHAELVGTGNAAANSENSTLRATGRARRR
jgi:hypothetical protein